MNSRPSKPWVVAAGEASIGRHGLDLDAFDPDFLETQRPIYDTLFGPGKYFDTHVRGWDNVPTEGPFLVVSNHGGGTTTIDALGLGASWYQREGRQVPLRGLGHDVVFAIPGVGPYLARCGMLRARRDTARRVLEAGQAALVMPGGDQDVWRPASKRYDVHFAGRTGYARTAIEMGVPIVPVAHVGAHHTLHVLTTGTKLAQKARFVRQFARADIWPVHVSFPWGLAVGPWPHLPPPTRMDYAFGPPVTPPSELTEASIEAFDRRVRAAMQKELDGLAAEWRARRPSLRRMAKRTRDGVRSLQELREVLAVTNDREASRANTSAEDRTP